MIVVVVVDLDGSTNLKNLPTGMNNGMGYRFDIVIVTVYTCTL